MEDKTKANGVDVTKTPEEIFAARMLETKNDAGEIVAIPFSPLADYYSSDFDESLFSPQVIAVLQENYPSFKSLAEIVKFHDYCKTNLNPRNKQKQRLSDDEFVCYNYINWLSLNEKGKLMLQAYQQQILPQIAQVYDIQKEFSIPNENGDAITGKIDLIASFTDDPNAKYICDNKTASASKPYNDDAVRLSEQLATYAEAEKNTQGAYLVVTKKYYEKAPHIRTNIVKDQVSEATMQQVFETYEKIVEEISEAGDLVQNYPKNESNCFAFGKMCPYYTMCKHNKKLENTGLVKLEKK
jgi:hypothetical protein